MQLAPGARIAQYEILRPLGAGGMGEVYCARDEKLGREIALKILPSELALNPESLRRFEQEARAASALNHPNIVTIYDIGQSEAFVWIAMELVDGEDLRTILKREPMALKSTLRIATKIADALGSAHDRGIVHRDLKPDNIMITPEGFVKLLDFGLAKQIRALSADDTTMPHTLPGTIFGTVAYMSPEQATGREMDWRSDQFSFGVLLYEMLAGTRPFERESRTETLAAILRDEPAPLSTLNEAVGRDPERIVHRCLAKRPNERYASTRDLARDLREIRDSFTNSSVERRAMSGPVATRSARNPAMAMAAGLVLLVLGAGGAFLWKRRDNARAITSLAVAPFRDLDGTVEGKVFADGISEMVATRLAEVRDLRVATPFDGAPIRERDDVAAIARRTGAHAVVRGTVQRGGGDVRVTVSLIDAKDGQTLAATTSTRPATDLFALQDAVADDVLRALGRTAPARSDSRAVVLGPEDQRRFTEAVGLLQRVRDEHSVDRAISLLEATMRNARESAPVNSLLARGLLYKSTLARRPALIEQALVYAVRGVALDGNDPETHITLGLLQNASGRSTEAAASFERALALRPNEPSALAGLAQSYDRQGRAADAEQTYRRALSVRPDDAGTLTRLGVFFQRQGRSQDALPLFGKATELQPDLAQAHANLGAALMTLGRSEEAQKALRKSLAIHPTAAGYSNLGTLQFSLGRYEEARQSFEQATLLAPSDFVVWANLGDACRWAPGRKGSAGDAYRRAIAAGRDALDVNPRDAYARSVVALCLARSGDPEAGQQEIRRALDLDPTNASVLYKAALVSLHRGHPDAAVSWVERAVANGYPVADLERDPELESLRALPSFQSALQSKR